MLLVPLMPYCAVIALLCAKLDACFIAASRVAFYHDTLLCGCRWQSPEYLLKLMGHRIVPVEVGSNYLAQGWCQKMITFQEFCHTAFGCADSQSTHRSDPHQRNTTTSDNQQSADVGTGATNSCKQCPVDNSSGFLEPHSKRQRSPSHTDCDTVKAAQADAAKSKLLYLAQHSLFDQIPDLRKDIMVCTLFENVSLTGDDMH